MSQTGNSKYFLHNSDLFTCKGAAAASSVDDGPMTRAEGRAQMAAMRKTITDMYVPNGKRGSCEPTIAMPNKARMSKMSTDIYRRTQYWLKAEQKTIEHIPKGYTGPHIAGFGTEKQVMPVITNSAHTA